MGVAIATRRMMGGVAPSNQNLGEQVALDFLARRSLRGERFTYEEMRRGKTPDLSVFNGDTFVFYCESKHVQHDDWLDNQLAHAPPMTLVGGVRRDPIYNRLSTHVHTAAKQFEAVNSSREYPNVLVFTSSDRHCKVGDLVSVLTGNFYAESGLIEPMFKQYSDGRIREEKHTIDLYVWHNDWPDAKHAEQFFWNEGSPHYTTLCALFESDPAKQKRFAL